MAGQDLTAVASGVVDAFNKNDWERSAAALAPNSLYNEVGTQRRLQGSDEIIAALKGWKQAMPDVKGTVTKAFASGNTAVLEVIWQGTQTGPLETPGGTIPASGKSQMTPAAWIFEFEGDKIRESRQYFDMAAFLQQIGAMQ